MPVGSMVGPDPLTCVEACIRSELLDSSVSGGSGSSTVASSGSPSPVHSVTNPKSVSSSTTGSPGSVVSVPSVCSYLPTGPGSSPSLYCASSSCLGGGTILTFSSGGSLDSRTIALNYVSSSVVPDDGGVIDGTSCGRELEGVSCEKGTRGHVDECDKEWMLAVSSQGDCSHEVDGKCTQTRCLLRVPEVVGRKEGKREDLGVERVGTTSEYKTKGATGVSPEIKCEPDLVDFDLSFNLPDGDGSIGEHSSRQSSDIGCMVVSSSSEDRKSSSGQLSSSGSEKEVNSTNSLKRSYPSDEEDNCDDDFCEGDNESCIPSSEVESDCVVSVVDNPNAEPCIACIEEKEHPVPLIWAIRLDLDLIESLLDLCPELFEENEANMDAMEIDGPDELHSINENSNPVCCASSTFSASSPSLSCSSSSSSSSGISSDGRSQNVHPSQSQQQQHSPPNVQVDESPLQPSMDKNKESLRVKLLLRRPINQLVEQGILPPPKTPPAFAGQRVRLERARMGDLLKAKIQQRPDRQELVRQHILEDSGARVAPSLAEKQRMLKRARLADSLNDHLIHRPGPLELVQKNILHAPDVFIEKAIKDGVVPFKATCEGQTPGPQLPHSYLGSEDESSSDVSSPASVSENGNSQASDTPPPPPQQPPPTPSCSKSASAPTIGSQGQAANTSATTMMGGGGCGTVDFLGQISLASPSLASSISSLSPMSVSSSAGGLMAAGGQLPPPPPPLPPIPKSMSVGKMSSSQGFQSILAKASNNGSSGSSCSISTVAAAATGGSSSSGGKLRHSKKTSKSKCQPKTRTIKFHEYKGPPSAQKNQNNNSNPNPSSNPQQSETSYELLLKQQQLFLQWQLEWQHKYPQIILPAMSKYGGDNGGKLTQGAGNAVPVQSGSIVIANALPCSSSSSSSTASPPSAMLSAGSNVKMKNGSMTDKFTLNGSPNQSSGTVSTNVDQAIAVTIPHLNFGCSSPISVHVPVSVTSVSTVPSTSSSLPEIRPKLLPAQSPVIKTEPMSTQENKGEKGVTEKPSSSKSSTEKTSSSSVVKNDSSSGSNQGKSTVSKLDMNRLSDCKVSELRAELKKRNLPVSGSKPQLIERLKGAECNLQDNKISTTSNSNQSNASSGNGKSGTSKSVARKDSGSSSSNGISVDGNLSGAQQAPNNIIKEDGKGSTQKSCVDGNKQLSNTNNQANNILTNNGLNAAMFGILSKGLNVVPVSIISSMASNTNNGTNSTEPNGPNVLNPKGSGSATLKGFEPKNDKKKEEPGTMTETNNNDSGKGPNSVVLIDESLIRLQQKQIEQLKQELKQSQQQLHQLKANQNSESGGNGGGQNHIIALQQHLQQKRQQQEYQARLQKLIQLHSLYQQQQQQLQLSQQSVAAPVEVKKEVINEESKGIKVENGLSLSPMMTAATVTTTAVQNDVLKVRQPDECEVLLGSKSNLQYAFQVEDNGSRKGSGEFSSDVLNQSCMLKIQEVQPHENSQRRETEEELKKFSDVLNQYNAKENWESEGGRETLKGYMEPAGETKPTKGTKSQMIDDVLEVLIRQGELPPSAATQEPQTPCGPRTSNSPQYPSVLDSKVIVNEWCLKDKPPTPPPLPPATFAVKLPTSIAFSRSMAATQDIHFLPNIREAVQFKGGSEDRCSSGDLESQRNATLFIPRPVPFMNDSFSINSELSKEAKHSLRISEDVKTLGKEVTERRHEELIEIFNDNNNSSNSLSSSGNPAKFSSRNPSNLPSGLELYGSSLEKTGGGGGGRDQGIRIEDSMEVSSVNPIKPFDTTSFGVDSALVDTFDSMPTFSHGGGGHNVLINGLENGELTTAPMTPIHNPTSQPDNMLDFTAFLPNDMDSSVPMDMDYDFLEHLLPSENNSTLQSHNVPANAITMTVAQLNVLNNNSTGSGSCNSNNNDSSNNGGPNDNNNNDGGSIMARRSSMVVNEEGRKEDISSNCFIGLGPDELMLSRDAMDQSRSYIPEHDFSSHRDPLLTSRNLDFFALAEAAEAGKKGSFKMIDPHDVVVDPLTVSAMDSTLSSTGLSTMTDNVFCDLAI